MTASPRPPTIWRAKSPSPRRIRTAPASVRLPPGSIIRPRIGPAGGPGLPFKGRRAADADQERRAPTGSSTHRRIDQGLRPDALGRLGPAGRVPLLDLRVLE